MKKLILLAKNKIINLTTRQHKFLGLERATLAEWQGASEDQKLVAKPMPANGILFFANGITSLLLTLSAISNIEACDPSLSFQESGPFEQTVHALNKYASFQKEFNIQNSDLAYAMRKALLIADLLIQADGTLDLAACQSVQDAFLSPISEEYEANMSKVIGQLSPSWQPFFASIRAPEEGPALLALRALFSLSSHQMMTDRHAKVAVLSALLAPYHQGPVGDCFAVADVIRDHEEYYFRAAEDYRSIVMNGSVQRPVNGKIDRFFFLPSLADEDRNQPFQLSGKGTLANGNAFLFDAPGFAAAISLMGGEDLPDLKMDCLESLLQNGEEKELQLTPSQVIAALAKIIASQTPNRDPATLASLGEYAFSSLTNHPVLRAVEAAFAAMAEDRPNDSIRSNINHSVDVALQSTWQAIGKKPGAASFHQAFLQKFNDSYRLLYQLDIPLSHVSEDGNSREGGFQLYQRAKDQTLGMRIETPEELQALICNAVAATEDTLGPNSKEIGEALIAAIQSEEFLKNVLFAYDPANQKEPNPVQNYRGLGRTPMQTCDGDNPYEVADIDTGGDYEKNVESYRPRDAKDLLFWSLSLAKRAPQELCPMNSPQHAFNFAPTHSDLSAFVKSGLSRSAWIQNRLTIPGIQVSRRPIDSGTAERLTKGMYEPLATLLPSLSSYSLLVQHLFKKTLSISGFATQLVKGIKQLLRANAAQTKQIALIVDSVLLQSLNPNDQAILEQSAIRFAYTNWNQGGKDLYFCGYFNPRTELVGFGTIFEDKTHLQPMDEDAWVNHQAWDVDLTPKAPEINALAETVEESLSEDVDLTLKAPAIDSVLETAEESLSEERL